MKRLLAAVFILIVQAPFTHAQDILNKGDISSIEESRVDLSKKFSFGKVYKKAASEDPQKFVARVLGSNSYMHHGAFELTDFRNSIVSFANYEFQGISVIIGLLLKPITSKGDYRLLRTVELSSGCGNKPEIKSVFLHNADPNSVGRELIIHGSNYCGRHGTNNYIYIYNGLITDDKLILTDFLSERCGYSEVKAGGEWDFDMGDENIEERRFIECDYGDFKAIRKALNNTKSE